MDTDEHQPLHIWTNVGEGGRLVILAEFREVLGLRTGDAVLLRLEDSELHLRTLPESVRRLQELVREYVPEDRLLHRGR